MSIDTDMTPTMVTVSLGTDAKTLQGMINQADGPTVFLLEEGTYEFDAALWIKQSDVSLRGAGQEKTEIKIIGDLGGLPAIQVGHGIWSPEVLAKYVMPGTAEKGATSVSFSEGHNIKVGDFLYFSQENSEAFLDEIGDTEWRKDNPLRTILVEVTGVEGAEVSFNPPLNFDYGVDATTVERRELLTGVELSGFSITGPYGEADPGAFENTVSGLSHSMILLGGTYGVSVSHVGVHDSISHGVTVAGSLAADISDLLVSGSHNKGGGVKGIGGNGYGLNIRDVYGSSFTELTIEDVRHAVLFSGYTSATDNNVHVALTNRDINFHGGRDQDNTVVVDRMVRTEEEKDYLGWATYFNEGTSFGAPTDASANSIQIRYLIGTDKGDAIYAHEDGSELRLEGGGDAAVTGPGDDLVLGGSGSDIIYASAGHDHIDGGYGDDTLIFEGARAEYTIGGNADALVFTHDAGVTVAGDIEVFQFSDGTFDGEDLLEGGQADPLPVQDDLPSVWDNRAEEGLFLAAGGDGWERFAAHQSTLLGADMEAASLLTDEDLDVVGNDLGNSILGNGGANRLEGRGGDDRMFGRAGDDTLLGGAGNDVLHGAAGNDHLWGGDGNDTLKGGTGNDVFRADAGEDVIMGGGGLDTVLFFNPLADYEIALDGAYFVVSNEVSEVRVRGVERFDFDGVGMDASDLPGAGDGDAEPPATEGDVPSADIWLPVTEAGLVTLHGDAGWQRLTTDRSIKMGDDLEAISLNSKADLTVVGNALKNNLLGNDGDNRFEGLGADDRIFGRAGDDTLLGGQGDDLLQGGSGADHLWGGEGNDTLKGGAGDDIFRASIGQDEIHGGGGNDTVVFENAQTSYTVTETDGVIVVADTMSSTRLRKVETVEFAGQGVAVQTLVDAMAKGLEPSEPTVLEEPADTSLEAHEEKTTGTDKKDPAQDAFWVPASQEGLAVIDGKRWWDRYKSDQSFVMGANLEGAAFSTDEDLSVFGNDLDNNVMGNSGANRVEGMAGDDRIFTRGGDDTILAGAGNDVVKASRGDDVIFGGAGDDSLWGGGGDDTFLASDGHDVVEGGGGLDTLLFTGALLDYEFSETDNAIVVMDDSSRLTVRGVETFVFDGYEVAQLELLDTYTQAAAAVPLIEEKKEVEPGRYLLGTTLDEVLQGGAGDDFLDGKAGNDTLEGGEGADMFIYRSGGDTDRISDFSLDEGDRLQLALDGIGTLEALQGVATSSAEQTSFAFENGDALIIEGVAFEDLASAIGFVFASDF